MPVKSEEGAKIQSPSLNATNIFILLTKNIR